MIKLLIALCAATIAVTHAAACDAEELRVSDAVVTLIEQVEVPARCAGVVAQIHVREGMQVQQGQLAAEMDFTEAQLDVDHAAVELKSAQMEAANEFRIRATEKAAAAAHAELQRAVESSEKYAKSISDSELDRLRFTAEKAELEHRQAKHESDQARLQAEVKANELETARRKLDLHRIVIPSAGVVVETKRNAGEWVEPGMPILRVVRMDPLRIEGFVPARSTIRKLVGAVARFDYGAPDEESRSVQAQVTFVSPEVDPINGQVRIWAELPNPGGELRPGIQGTLVIRLGPAAEKGEDSPSIERVKDGGK